MDLLLKKDLEDLLHLYYIVLINGVDIFRVHDVYETQQAIEVYKKIACL